MKINLLLVAAFLSATFNFTAQSGLSNLSFENWTTTAFGPSPSGWFGFNITKQTSGAQQGSNYVRINNLNNSQGAMMLGTITSLSGPIKGGAPCSQIPVAITGFFKTSGLVTGDKVGLTAYTSYLGSINALASFSQSINTAAWTSFSASFLLINPGPVDSVFVIASSGNLFGGGNNSSTAILDLDNISLGNITNTNTATGIDVQSLGTSFLVYPNPASGELNIISKDQNAVSLVITGLDGRIIEEQMILSEKTKVNLQNYESGIYFYVIQDEQKNTLLTNKFVVSK